MYNGSDVGIVHVTHTDRNSSPIVPSHHRSVTGRSVGHRRLVKRPADDPARRAESCPGEVYHLRVSTLTLFGVVTV